MIHVNPDGGAMSNLQIKGIEETLYAQIKKLAVTEHRSMSQQVLFVIKDYMARGKALHTTKTPAQVLLQLSGSWEDERTPEDIVADMRRARKNSRKLAKGW